uniref:Nucleoporin NUP42 n=1 Tax=Otus sunia TaxID=257818 RepID=A0A8C8AJ47_9STRI
MAICQFFLQGRCRFGERCWNEHPRGGGGGGRYGPSGPPPPRYQGTSGGGGGWGTTNQRYTNVIQPSTFKSNTWGGSRDHGRGFFGSSDFGSSGGSSRNADFSQNRFSALMNSQNIADGYKDEEERLLKCVVRDMETWESSKQWKFSSYSPMKEKPNVSGFQDISPEELRLEYYNCRANNNIQNYMDSVQQLSNQWKNNLVQLKSLNSSTKAALNTASQPLPSFGFGGQQTSSFGLSNFPVNSSSNSASSFSFKISSSLNSASSGNTPAFGSSSAGCNPAFGFGSSSAVNTSSTTPLTDFRASNAAVAASPSHSSSTLFGQTASASGHNITSASSAVANNTTSGKLFTPKSELSAEELKQFEAKKFTIGKIPLKPPPLELLQI